ncbi:GNAT family N-acetyltransferase [Aliikangiella marina]|uniref:GNAT family N-acetyltransferase n=1 Tax=Aliikangiella marina TaxID=1712262 RepID=A0A545TDZ8_9GAMM|nr:bifunctional helix-turn-helix transcriptional regulator/GNAT family N-acetyltransferase [Aliikangiella marina]TQV75452.1 GNAT family N-acetyltransferase [Aliikangiella marina]
MHSIENAGLLGLGSRFKKLSELIFKQCDDLYRARGVNLQSRCFPILQLLSTHETISVTSLAEMLGQTHPAVSQMSKKLESQGWLYHEADSSDERRRLLALTPQGYELVDKLQPVWRLQETVMNRLLEISGYGLLENIALLERELEKQSLRERVEELEKQNKQDRVEIIHFEKRYAKDFYRLNKEWLDKYFYLESMDHEVLSNPESQIIEKGGFILLARIGEDIIGAAALTSNQSNQLELSKICVEAGYQGLGIGEKLARAAINQYQATDFSGLYLESNRKLLPALNLYFKLGFREKPFPAQIVPHARADIYMELPEQASSR